MHEIQKRLVDLAQTHDLRALGLRQIGRMIGEPHPQKVKHHLQKLNFIPSAPDTRIGASQSKLISIPIVGMANCGEPTIYADESKESVLQVSKKLVPENASKLFALKAVGDSMNRANINGSSINDGDFVIVNSEDKDFRNGDYIVSVIGGMANVKRYLKDEASGHIILLSESSRDRAPIYIHEDDMAYYLSSGKVVAVLKVPTSEYVDDVVYDN